MRLCREKAVIVWNVALEFGCVIRRTFIGGVLYVQNIARQLWKCFSNSVGSIPAQEQFGNSKFIPFLVFPMLVQS